MVATPLIAAVLALAPAAAAPPNDWPWLVASHAYRLPVVITADVGVPTSYAVTDVDFSAAFADAGAPMSSFDPGSLIVHEVDDLGGILDSSVGFQFDADPGFKPKNAATGELILEIAGPTAAGVDRNYLVYFDTPQAAVTGATVADRVTVTTGTSDEGLPAMSIATSRGTWYYQTQAGGFSSIIDDQGADWVGWNPSTGASGEFRGVPNLVYPAGYFHPGATGHTTTLRRDGALRTSFSTTSPNAAWVMTWDVYPTHAVATIDAVGGSYWFLYEGTPGGSVDPTTDFWRTSAGTTGTLDQSFDADIAAPEWVQFGDPVSNRSLFMINDVDDAQPDSYYTLGGEMTVFGFGRSQLDRTLTGVGRSFTVGLLGTAAPAAAATAINGFVVGLTVTIGTAESSGVAPPGITIDAPATPGAGAFAVAVRGSS